MADGPALIVEPGGATPFGYQLAPGEAMQLATVAATFDGSGAAGNFLPALGLYAQSGELLSRTFTSEAVTAGDSAEVTFSPF
jgi:hypothetical protein